MTDFRSVRVQGYFLRGTAIRTAHWTVFHPERFFKMAVSKQVLIHKYFSGRSVSFDHAIVNNNCPFAYIQDHIKIMGGDYF